jgi:uncharacterized membrane protein YidH (DUF202 family)
MTSGPGMAGRDPGPDMEEQDPGLARERTALAWTRTALSVAALGGAMLKVNPPAGIVVLAMSAPVWWLGRPLRRERPGPASGRRLLLVTITVTLVSCAALALTLRATLPAGIELTHIWASGSRGGSSET